MVRFIDATPLEPNCAGIKMGTLRYLLWVIYADGLLPLKLLITSTINPLVTASNIQRHQRPEYFINWRVSVLQMG